MVEEALNFSHLMCQINKENHALPPRDWSKMSEIESGSTMPPSGRRCSTRVPLSSTSSFDSSYNSSKLSPASLTTTTTNSLSPPTPTCGRKVIQTISSPPQPPSTTITSSLHLKKKKPRLHVSPLSAAKMQSPTVLIGREEEISSIQSFISNCIEKKQGGCAYVCGPPGTGKTAVLSFCVSKFKVGVEWVEIN